MQFIYSLFCPVRERIRYIGKTNNLQRRWQLHLTDVGERDTSYRARWLNKLRRGGHRPRMEVLFAVPDDMSWKTAEQFFIASARYLDFPLTNATGGGDGLTAMTPELRERLSKSIKRAQQREDVRKRIQSGLIGSWKDNDERRRRASERIRAAYADPASKQNLTAFVRTEEGRRLIGETSRQRMADPARRARLSDLAKKQWQDTEHLTLRSAMSKKQMQDPANRELSRRGAVAQNADPEYIKRRDEFWSKPEALKAAAEAAKAGWDDPVKKAARVVAMKAAWVRRKARTVTP